MEMGNGRWEMGDGKWEMGNGKWEMGNRNAVKIVTKCRFIEYPNKYKTSEINGKFQLEIKSVFVQN